MAESHKRAGDIRPGDRVRCPGGGFDKVIGVNAVAGDVYITTHCERANKVIDAPPKQADDMVVVES